MEQGKRIYFDYSATTPVDPEVVQAMLPYFTEVFGNPSSIHREGQRSEAALELARESIARNLDCDLEEILFTSGGTEADNLALRGTAFARREATGAHRILVTPVEHEAVRKTVEQLRSQHGFHVESVPVDTSGKVDLDHLAALLDANVAVVSVIYGNNEVGTINPIQDIARLCHAQGVPLHTDAVQAMGYCAISSTLGADLISAGAHKFYGPKGVGFLYKRKTLRILPTQTGGSQEWSLRAGTSNVPYLVGMARALEITRARLPEDALRFQALRDEVIQQVTGQVPGSKVTGSLEERLSNHSSFVFEGVDGNELVMLLDRAGFAVSSGSACKTGNPEPSAVLTALGYSPQLAKGSLRISVGRGTASGQIAPLIEALSRSVNILRGKDHG